jgi:mono/diheme cytochrome c family protein
LIEIVANKFMKPETQSSVDRQKCHPALIPPLGWIVLGVNLATFCPTAMAARHPSMIEQGKYMARMADCEACHTKIGGTPYAGGLVINTPFGTITYPNITHAPHTGIGDWSNEKFYRAVADGIGRRGEYLYPAMPFTSYNKMTRSDILAVKTYLFSLKPVHAPRKPNHMAFPFDIRRTLFVWRTLYFSPKVYRPDANRSVEWNRGAYLVEGPGHCGECHSPRNIMQATEKQQSLAGGHVGAWWPPNISSDRLWGLGDWSTAAIVAFLKTGAHDPEGVAFGPMAEVVHDSLRHISIADIQAIAVFLKSSPKRTSNRRGQAVSTGDLRHGSKLYLENCAKCHQADGEGFPDAIPNLATNASVVSARPDDTIDIVLRGQHAIGTYGTMPSFAEALGNQDITDVTNYLRHSWGNNAPTKATRSLVARLRAKAVSARKAQQ